MDRGSAGAGRHDDFLQVIGMGDGGKWWSAVGGAFKYVREPVAPLHQRASPLKLSDKLPDHHYEQSNSVQGQCPAASCHDQERSSPFRLRTRSTKITPQ